MALAGELAKYIGNEIVKIGGKDLATKTATSALSNLAPKIATKAGAKMATGSVLSSLVPSTARKLASGVELGSEAIPLFRGQTNRLDRLDYNKGLSPNSNGFFMTPNKSATDSWAGKGVVSVDADPNDIMTLSELNSLKKDAERYLRDPKYQMELYNTNPTQAEIYDALEAGDNYQELSRLTKKPFIERDGGQGTELGEIVFFPDTTPELTSRYNADLASGKNQWITRAEDETVSGTSLPVGTKIRFNKDLSIKSIDKPSRGRGWFADNSDNPHIAQAIKQSGADKYLGKPKINYSLAEEPDITLYHGTPNKFEDFDDSLPSVWFSDSDKNLRDTGLSIKGGQPMNIMERQLPKDLKIADEDLADRLTKQQLQDRGYAGIAYTERGPNGDETYYEIFSPNKTLRKMPEVQQSLYGGGYGSSGGFAKDVKAIGTKDVAPIDPETLPEGYDFYRKVSEKNKAKYGWVYDEVSKATGKPARRITNADLRQFLEDNYPDYVEDGKMTKYELEQRIQDAMEDELTDEAWENGADLSALVHNKYPRAGIRDIYNDHSGRTGKLDRELSRRLGIGESNSVMMDRLNNDTGRAAGDVAENRVGIKFDNWSSDEDKVGVMGHERLHLFQNASKRNDFNYEKVKPVYQDLHEDLKKALLNEDEIRKAHAGSEFERMGGMSYWGSDIEQEARMLEAYLYSEGYVKARPYRVDEFASKMDIIKPAFDKFFKKLRALSKKGIALPAVAGLVGIGALAGKKDDKKLDNIK